MRDDSSPDAADLIRAGRAAFRPDAADRDRVLRSLEGILGDGALRGDPAGGGTGARAFGAPHSLKAAKVWGGLAALAAAGGMVVALHVSTRKALPVAVPPMTSSTSATEAEPAPGVVSPSTFAAASDEGPVHAPPGAVRASSPPRASGRPAASRAMSDSLKEEVRLLSRAERQVGDGLGEDALATLDEHERRFPKGALAEERMVARVEALCTLARIPDAKAEMARLARAYPASHHLNAAARRFCGDALGAAP